MGSRDRECPGYAETRQGGPDMATEIDRFDDSDTSTANCLAALEQVEGPTALVRLMEAQIGPLPKVGQDPTEDGGEDPLDSLEGPMAATPGPEVRSTPIRKAVAWNGGARRAVEVLSGWWARPFISWRDAGSWLTEYGTHLPAEIARQLRSRQVLAILRNMKTRRTEGHTAFVRSIMRRLPSRVSRWSGADEWFSDSGCTLTEADLNELHNLEEFDAGNCGESGYRGLSFGGFNPFAIADRAIAY